MVYFIASTLTSYPSSSSSFHFAYSKDSTAATFAYHSDPEHSTYQSACGRDRRLVKNYL